MIKPRIKTCHHIIQAENGDICIGDIKENSYIFRQPRPEFLALLDKLDGTRTVSRLEKELKGKFPAIDSSQIEEVLHKLAGCGLLEDAAEHTEILSERELELYDRQMLYFSAMESEGKPGFQYQEKLKSQRVTVLGMGGWGTWMCLNLALAGFGCLRIVDGDIVELSNLNRQVLYGMEDIGRRKVDAACKRLTSINPFVQVEPHFEFVRNDAAQIQRLIAGSTMVFLAWANTGYYRDGTCEELIHRIASEAGIPIIEFGGDPLDITVGPIYLNDGRSPTFWDLRSSLKSSWVGQVHAETYRPFKEARIQHRFRNGNRQVNAWQNAASISAMAGLMAGEAVKVATGIAPSHLVGRRLSLSLADFSCVVEPT